MSPEAMRVAIAEACGYAPYQGGWATPDDRDIVEFNELPDYLNDLNAMHEAEKVLTEAQRHAYIEFLNQQQNEIARETKDWSKLDNFWRVHTTAAQRAEAFCRTFYPERFAQPPAHPTGHTEGEG